MIETRCFAYFDNAGDWHEVLQTWVIIPGTGVWAVVAVEQLPFDPASAPTRPTRPA